MPSPTVRSAFLPSVLLLLAHAAGAQQSHESLKNRIDALLEAGEDQQALAVIDRALAAEPRSGPLFWLRAYVKGALGDPRGGLTDADRAVELAPTFPNAWIERGYLKACIGDFLAAIDDYDRAIGLDPANPVAFGDRGDARQRLEQYELARRDYDEAIRLHPDYGAAYHNRAFVCSRLGDYDQAVRDNRLAAKLLPEHPMLWMALAADEAKIGLLADSRSTLGRALAIVDPEQQPRMLRTRALLAWQSDDRAAARVDLERAVELAAVDGAAFRYTLGCLQLAEGEDVAASKSFLAASEHTTIGPWARLMAWCIAARNDLDAASARLTEALPDGDDPLVTALRDLCTGLQEIDDDGAQHGTYPLARVSRWFFAGWRARCEGRSERARELLCRVVNTGRTDLLQWHVAREWLRLGPGAPSTASLGATVAPRPGTETPELVVESLEATGAAAQQGLQVGDHVLGIAGQPASLEQWREQIARLVPGQVLPLRIRREDTERTLWLLAGARVE